jgi:hypothetical protein
MKKLNLFFAFITLLLLSSCNRNVTNPSTDGNTIEKDTSLLFALNIGSSSISDTSVYKDVITINNTTLSFQNNALGFAEDYDEFDPLHEPFIRIQLPEKKLSNKLTAFIELKNSLQNSKSDYGDTSNYYIWATLGEYATHLQNTWDMGLEKNIGMSADNVPGKGWFGWKGSDNTDCNSPNMSPNSPVNPYLKYAQDIPFGVTNFTKMIFVLNDNTAQFYVNGRLIASENNTSTNLGRCNNNVFVLISARGSLIKNFKIWNKALTEAEIKNL